MATTITKSLSADEFWALPDRPGVRLELVDGEVIEMPGSGVMHMTILLLVFDLLREHARDNGLGLVYPDGSTYLLKRNPDILRVPDASFIASDRIPEDWPPVGYSEIIPDLVVEIVSPSNSASELRRRTQDYVNAGVALVWILWPDERSVTVYAGSASPQEFAADDLLDGGDVLPGFSVTVADLFNIDW